MTRRVAICSIIVAVILLICMPVIDILSINSRHEPIFSVSVPHSHGGNKILGTPPQIAIVCNCAILYTKYVSLYYQIYESRYERNGIPMITFHIPKTNLYFRLALPFM